MFVIALSDTDPSIFNFTSTELLLIFVVAYELGYFSGMFVPIISRFAHCFHGDRVKTSVTYRNTTKWQQSMTMEFINTGHFCFRQIGSVFTQTVTTGNTALTVLPIRCEPESARFSSVCYS